MKIGIVGAGFVGSTAAYAMMMRGVGTEIVLVDRNMDLAVAQAEDIHHATPFAYPMPINAGDYDALADSCVVVLAAGANQKPGETRLELLERNAAVFRDIIPHVLKAAPGAILLVATNPVDIMTQISLGIARRTMPDVPADRLIGLLTANDDIDGAPDVEGALKQPDSLSRTQPPRTPTPRPRRRWRSKTGSSRANSRPRPPA